MFVLTRSLVFGACLLASGALLAAEEIHRDELDAWMEECQRQREENIAPLREEAIENCVTNQRRDREACERHNANFGERRQGGTMPGLFWHLPVCEQAVAADRYFRMNPRRDTFTLP